MNPLRYETETRMNTEEDAPTRAEQLIGDFSPKLVSLTDDVLFGDIWARPELSPRDRSLMTVAALIAGGNTEQLTGHLQRARQNGLTETALQEVIVHLAFYAGGRTRCRPSRSPRRSSRADETPLSGALNPALGSRPALNIVLTDR